LPTIQDVAEAAKVSVKTVSRVLSNYEHVSERTREKVHAAIEKLNYAPNAMARHLNFQERQSIGMLYGDPSSGYQSQLNHSMLKACSNAQRYLAVELFNEKSSKWVEQVDHFLRRTQVKNLVLVPPMCDSPELHRLLEKRKIRFVLISPSRAVSGASLVTMDDRLAGYEATKYLIDRGHRRIAHIAGHEKHVVTFLRRQGFEDAISSADIDLDFDKYVRNGRFRFRETLECAEALLSDDRRPTAIFAANDQMAVAVMMAAHRMGISIPEDLSIIGFDNAPISRSIWPSLTTIAQPYDAIAEASLELLRIGMENEISARVLPHSLIERETVACLQ